MRLIWIIFILFYYIIIGCGAPRYVVDKPVRKWIHSLSVSWVGVLSYKKVNDAKEAIAGIILIHTKLAMGNAYEVAIINKRNIRKTTKAMFLTESGNVQYCTVTNYILHPEFDEDTLNTIALLKLEYNEKVFQWRVMNWPSEFSRMDEYEGEVYVLGYTDRHKALEQEMHRMEFVNLSDCRAFYKNEQLDSKWMAPTEFQCFKRKYSSEQCVIDSGMALAAHSEGVWTLLGMSILGPSCSLPARFVDFARFVPWVHLHGKRPMRRVMPEYNINWPNYDKLIFEKLHDDTMVMRPYYGTEVIYGQCDEIDGIQMYHEEGTFEVEDFGLGIYGLSIWDKMYLNFTCVMLTVECVRRTTQPFSFNFGLMQFSEDLTDMTRVVPIVQRNQTVRPKIVHLKEGHWLDWFYWKKDKSNVTSVVFRFEFYKKARIKVIFYANMTPAEELKKGPSKSTTPDYKIKRSRRPHPKHIKGQRL